jgi:hypothetical protein
MGEHAASPAPPARGRQRPLPLRRVPRGGPACALNPPAPAPVIPCRPALRPEVDDCGRDHGARRDAAHAPQDGRGAHAAGFRALAPLAHAPWRMLHADATGATARGTTALHAMHGAPPTATSLQIRASLPPDVFTAAEGAPPAGAALTLSAPGAPGEVRVPLAAEGRPQLRCAAGARRGRAQQRRPHWHVPHPSGLPSNWGTAGSAALARGAARGEARPRRHPPPPPLLGHQRPPGPPRCGSGRGSPQTRGTRRRLG